MHFLSVRDSAGHHLMLPPAATTSPALPAQGGFDAGNGVAAVAADDLARAFVAPTDGLGEQITVIACAVLLLVGLGTALAFWLRRRYDSGRTSATWQAPPGTVRGPPKTAVRLVLCVERT